MRYRLRTLLIVITMLGIWMGVEVRGARRQASAVSEIQKLGGWVLYDFEYDPQVSGTSRKLNGRSWVPRWVSARIGVDWFHTVVAVNMVYDLRPGGGRTDNREFNDAVKGILAGVPHLRQLFLKDTQTTDECLAAISRLHRLERLYCWNAVQVTDAGLAHLRKLPKLKDVHLSNSQITDESLGVFGDMVQMRALSLQQNAFTDRGLARLTKLNHLKELWIDMGPTDITDQGLAYLENLQTLEVLAIQDTHATQEGVDTLKLAIPGLKQVLYSAATRPRPGTESDARQISN
jgi:hypothetical protein